MTESLKLEDILPSPKRRDNFQRLARLLMSEGTVLLREAFDIKCPPINLPTTLQNPATKKLFKAAKLSKSQRDCLYPSPGMYGKSTDFDMTLLFRLLRTICGLTPPATGWDCLPSSKDQSFGADLARIKFYCNSVYGYVIEDMEIADDEFSRLWREISEALVRIAGQISPAKAKEWKNVIDTFLNDPLTEEDKRYEQELQRWYQNDLDVREYMKEGTQTCGDELVVTGRSEGTPEGTHGVLDFIARKHQTNNIVAKAMEFEAKHRECVRVLTYTNDGHVKVKFYVLSGKTGIPETLKAAAQDYFKEMNVKLEWFDLYRDTDEILKIRPLEYPSGKRKALNDSQVDDINKVISENLHVLVRHRNITAVQPSLKITNSKQTGTPCITLYVLCKGVIPDGECPFPLKLGSYPVDVVDGIWFRTDDPWLPNEAQKQSEVLCWGASIGVQGEDAAGTLGAIVKDDETFYVLSCKHVMRHSTNRDIIHPALNDHLNYLNYHLQQYGKWIMLIITRESYFELANQFSFGHIAGLEELSAKFQELRGIRETHQHHTRVTARKLEAVRLHEEAFERGLTPPRVIAKYSVGISGNVTWNDGQQYYVDAALAELTLKEVDSLRQSQTAEMIGTGDHPSGEFSSRRKARGELCKSGRTTGFTRSGHHVEPSIFLRANFVKVNDHNDALFSVLKNARLCQRCWERFVIGEELSPCDSCEIDTATLRDSLWFKNCLCIDYKFDFGEAKVFATEGDSGAVLFERNEDGKLQAFGIIFAELRCSYKLMTLATPLQIALESLSREISKNTNLTLLSNYE